MGFLFQKFQHARTGRGYEVSSAGDRRFSAFFARLEDGRTIEQHYQCDVKGYDLGGTNWKLGKGNPPLDPSTDLWKRYLELWVKWAEMNPGPIEELRRAVRKTGCGCLLTDRFATTGVNQARALAEILNATEPTAKAPEGGMFTFSARMRHG